MNMNMELTDDQIDDLCSTENLNELATAAATAGDHVTVGLAYIARGYTMTDLEVEGRTLVASELRSWAENRPHNQAFLDGTVSARLMARQSCAHHIASAAAEAES